MMNTAGHEIIARTFRRGACEHRGFDLDESHFVHGLANLEKYFVAQSQIAMRFGTSQIKIAKAESGFFGRVDFIFDRKWRCFGVV